MENITNEEEFKQFLLENIEDEDIKDISMELTAEEFIKQVMIRTRERSVYLKFGHLKKGQKRGLVVINSLLNRDLYQQDLKKILERLLNEDITDGILANILSDLEKLQIIKRRPVRKEGFGANPNLVFLPTEYHNLKNLLEYIYSINGSTFNIRLKRRFTRSKYAKKTIGNELILKIQTMIESIFQEKRGDYNFVFSDEEKQIILKILQNSPSALFYVTQNPYEELFNKSTILFLSQKLNIYENGPLYVDYDSFLKMKRDRFKKYFLFNLQIRLSEDLLKFGSKDPIEYTMSLKFLQKGNKGLNVRLSQGIEDNMVKNRIKTQERHNVFSDFI